MTTTKTAKPPKIGVEKHVLAFSGIKRIVTVKTAMSALDGLGFSRPRQFIFALGAVTLARLATKTFFGEVDADKIRLTHPQDSRIVSSDGTYDFSRLLLLAKYYMRPGLDGIVRMYESDLEIFLKKVHGSDSRKDLFGLYKWISKTTEWGTLFKDLFPGRSDLNLLTNKHERFITIDEVFLNFLNMSLLLNMAKQYQLEWNAKKRTVISPKMDDKLATLSVVIAIVQKENRAHPSDSAKELLTLLQKHHKNLSDIKKQASLASKKVNHFPLAHKKPWSKISFQYPKTQKEILTTSGFFAKHKPTKPSADKPPTRASTCNRTHLFARHTLSAQAGVAKVQRLVRSVLRK